MNYFTKNTTLLRHRLEHKHLKFHIDELPIIEWDEVINCINYNVINKIPIKTLSRLGVVVHDTSPSSKITQLLEFFSELDTAVLATAHLYVSLTSESQTFGWHRDTADVIFWQVLGKTLFSVKDAGETITYNLEVNDLLFIPKGMLHNTSPLTPRAGVSFGLEYMSG